MMTNLKKIFACVAIAGSLTAVAVLPAQAQSQVIQNEQSSVTPYQKNLKLISAFSKTNDAKESSAVLEKIENNLREEIAASKRQILTEKQGGNDAQAQKSLKMTEKLGAIYNKIITASRAADGINKSEITSIFKDYQALH